MIKKLYPILLPILIMFTLCSCGSNTENNTTEGKYNLQEISEIYSFNENIENYASMENITKEQFFKIIQKVAYTPTIDEENRGAIKMTSEELNKINNIRNKYLNSITTNSIMIKCITEADVAKYMDGSYKTVGGYICYAPDTKKFKTVKDLYYGIRLDYVGSKFSNDSDFIYTLRFKLKDVKYIQIPREKENNGYVDHNYNSYPFGGAGFTTGTDLANGVPEWHLYNLETNKNMYIEFKDGAEIWQTYQDGTEKLYATYHINIGKFVLKEENKKANKDDNTREKINKIAA